MDLKKSILVYGLLAMLLLISFEVSARDLTETSSNTEMEIGEQKNVENDPKHNGYPGNRGNGNGGHRYSPECPNGCCSNAYNLTCTKCCSYAGQPVDLQT